MNSKQWQQAKDIFNSAIEVDAAERDRYIASACNGNSELQDEVEKLLNSYDSQFMENPIAGNDNDKFAGSKIGRYEIVRLIAAGGMGEVYLASDSQLDRKVAIKFLNEKYESNESNLLRFIQEAKAASALNHPNILTVHEIGETDSSHFIVSEFVEGKTLREILNERKLRLSEVFDIASQIAGALSAAHSARIIHRDIKPENVIVRSDGYVKVLDFGLAKLVPEQPSFIGLEAETIRQNQTAQGLIMGTVSYMSPEQARGESVDARTDIFSLGVLIFEMLTGRTPFAGDSRSETFANLINKDAPLLSQYVSGLPDELERIVQTMLRKNRDERYRSTPEMVADLNKLRQRITSGDSVIDSQGPQSEKATEILNRTTGDVERQTLKIGEFRGVTRRFWPVLAMLAVLIISAVAYAVYWRQFSSPSEPQVKSLAVLPLKSLDSGDNYLGFGIADAVIRRMGQAGVLTVRPTSAIKRYVTEDTDALTAAQQLTVDAVLEGTVQRADETLRITVNLLRVKDGASLWSERFDTQTTDVLALQDKLAQRVAARLQLQLDPQQQARLAKRTTSDPVAYDYYVKGVYAFNQRRFDKLAKEQIDTTIDFLKKAIESDPNYALAHAKLANAYAWKGLFIETDDQSRLLALANEEIAKADALDPQLAETNISRFRILFSGPGGWRIEEAIRGLLAAQQIDPNLGHEELSDMYLHIGLEDLMDREIRKALEIDPTSEWIKLQMLIFYQLLNRYDDYLKIRNEYFPEEPISQGYYLVNGDLKKTRELLDEEAKKDPRGANPVIKSMLLALEGRRKESEALVPAILKEVDKLRPSYHHETYDIACIYAVNGNAAEAVKWLRETAAYGNPQYTQFGRDKFLDNIRKSPEFIRFMTELKPQYERYRSEFR